LHGEAVQSGPDPKARNVAEDWLKDLLKHGPLPTEQVRTEAKTAGLSWITGRRAAEALGIRSRKQAFSGGWVWALPTE
jgi:putative DNA primase/helicase